MKKFKFKLNDDEESYTLERCLCKDVDVKIPNTYDDKPVTIIGKNAFSGCNHMRHVHIPDTITKICDYAFFNCERLQEVKLPDNVIEIEKYAFALCDNLKEIRLSKNLKIIGKNAFEYSRLIGIIIPPSVESIGEFAFNIKHPGMEYAIIQSLSLNDVGEYAFLDTHNIYISLPKEKTEGEGWKPKWAFSSGAIHYNYTLKDDSFDAEINYSDNTATITKYKNTAENTADANAQA
jgi:hypothetical protein